MLMRTDPFRELDRLTQQVFGNTQGTWSRPTAMPMDAYRVGDEFVVAFDLPGVSPDAIELDVEHNVLTVKAERRPIAETEHVEMQVAERPLGAFSRQLFLGETLDSENVSAHYESGVLTLRIPVAPQAKPRKIEISHARERQRADRRLSSAVGRVARPHRFPQESGHGHLVHRRAGRHDRDGRSGSLGDGVRGHHRSELPAARWTVRLGARCRRGPTRSLAYEPSWQWSGGGRRIVGRQGPGPSGDGLIPGNARRPHGGPPFRLVDGRR